MNLELITQRLKHKAPTILTFSGGVGVIATSIFTAKAHTKASKILENAKAEKNEELTMMEKFKTVGHVYIPAILFGAATISCIFGANYLNAKNQASLMGAYALLNQSYKEYKNKVIDIYGKESNNSIEDEIAKDKMEASISVSNGNRLFYDLYSGRYFESTMEELLKAEQEVNKMLHTGWGVGINDFYKLIGLEELDEYKNFGWTNIQMEEMYWHAWIEFDHRETVIDEIDCTVISIPLEPVINYLEEY